MRLNRVIPVSELDNSFGVEIIGNYTGPLILSGDPTTPYYAATKQYVDSMFVDMSTSRFISGIFPTSRLPAYYGDAVSSPGANSFTLDSNVATPGTYTKGVIDAKGRVESGGPILESDISSIGFANIISGKPTTLSGYGITDLLSNSGGTIVDNLTITGSAINSSQAITKSYIDLIVAGSTSGIHTGDVTVYPVTSTPAGYLRCNGATLDKTTYADLYAVVGDVFNYDTAPGSGKPWKQQYQTNSVQSADITGWATGTNIPVALTYSQAIVTKNRVYLLGGHNGSTIVSTVYTASINADGTLGVWITGTSLPVALAHSQVIVTKNRVYLLGGYSSGTSSAVYTAPINTDGTLGAWAIGTNIPVALAYSQAIVTKSRVYLLGGSDGTLPVSTVYTAPINADGTLGTWVTGTSLPVTLMNSQVIVTKNRVYLLGGYRSGSSPASAVYTVTINTDGTLGTWTTGTDLPGTLEKSQAIVTKNRAYLLGGYGNGASYLDTVYTAPINADGTLGTWVTGTSLPVTLMNSQVIVTNSKVFLIGGFNGSGHVSTVYYANFTGGSNDYSQYYDGTAVPNDPANFRIPDFTHSESLGRYYFIKT